MPTAYSVTSVPFLFSPADYQYNTALNANFTGIGTAIVSTQSTIGTIQSDITTINGEITSLQNNTWWYTVTQFGATGNGVTDDSTAFQNTINAAQLARGVVYIPPGSYLIKSQLTITGGISIRGAGVTLSFLLTGTDGITVFYINTALPCSFYDFRIDTSLSLTGGQAILVNPSGTENAESRFENMQFSSQFVGIFFQRASGFMVTNCTFTNSVSNSIVVENQNNVDSGDSTIIGNLFAGAAGSVAINHQSSGGLKVIGNKINGVTIGYALSLPSGTVFSSISILSANSIENCSSAGMFFTSAAPTPGQWRSVEITGNEIMIPGPANGILIGGGTVTTWLLGVTICGNSFETNVTGSTANAINIVAATGVSVIGNYIESFSAGGGTGIAFSANSNGTTILGNITKSVGTSISNSSTNTSAANNVAI